MPIHLIHRVSEYVKIKRMTFPKLEWPGEFVTEKTKFVSTKISPSQDFGTSGLCFDQTLITKMSSRNHSMIDSN